MKHMSTSNPIKIVVVIPCYKVKNKIFSVLNSIPEYIHTIYCVDDCCPEESGNFILKRIKDPRVKVIFNQKNLGVGGAVIAGYKQALKDGANILIKIDGDGQMDLSNLYKFILPLENNEADYTKGNRFFLPKYLQNMPKIRIFGNACLSFLTKLSTGYWSIMDPTNGFIAIRAEILSYLDLERISKRYFFESDMLYNLAILKAKVEDIPSPAIYADEISNLKVRNVIFPFLKGNIKNFLKRFFYNYLLRDFSLGSLSMLFAIMLITFGAYVGIKAWIVSYYYGKLASAGTVMLAALPFLVGLQFLLLFFHYDITQQPNKTISPFLSEKLKDDKVKYKPR